METQNTYFRSVLSRELEVRALKNPAYSLRAFARDLGMPASKVSEVLSGKRGMSLPTAKLVLKNLSLSPEERDLFVASLESTHARSKKSRDRATQNLLSLKKQSSGPELDLSTFKVLSEWWHFAILELSETKNFDSDSRAIAQRLGLPRETIQDAIKRLIKLGLLEFRRGKLVQTKKDLIVQGGTPSQAVRQFHTQVIKQAIDSLEKVSLEEREIASLIFALDQASLPRARAILKRFRRFFASRLQKSESKNRLYCLNLNFFPLDKIKNEEKP